MHTAFLRHLRYNNISSYRKNHLVSNSLTIMRMTELHSSSRQIIDPENSSRKDTCIRILCLHGKGGDGRQFLSKSLMPLRSLVEKRLAYDATKDDVEDKITVEWETITAPYAIDPDDDSRGYSWWKMSPGMRSYNADEVREMIPSPM